MRKIINKSMASFIFSIAAFVVLCFSLSFSSEICFADSYIEVVSVKATFLDGFDAEGKPQYLYGVDYASYFSVGGNTYAKDITVTFLITDASYYIVDCLAEGEEAQEGTKFETVPANGLVSYEVEGSGVYNVTCSVFSGESALLGKQSVTVRSDETVPSVPTASSMTKWLPQCTNFDVVLDWSGCRDELSGIKRVYYRVYYEDGEILSPVYYESVPSDKTYVVLTKSAKVSVTVFDKAGNYVKKDFLFDKFDGVGPMCPSFSVSPLVTDGVFRKEYTLTVEYYPDGESGLADVQHYIMNGVSYEYEYGVGIVLTEQKNYSFVFYSMDKVGNRSEYVKYDLPGTAFDVREPYLDISTIQTEIDLTNKKGVCYLTFSASDYKESGIDTVAFYGKDFVFTKEETPASNNYSLRYDCFDSEYAHRLVITDKVGNMTEYQLVVDYFADEEINAACKELALLYRNADFSACSAAAKTRIDNAVSQVNYLINTSGNTPASIKEACRQAKECFMPIAVTKYVIDSTPFYASSSVTFTVDQNDFPGETFGNSLEVTMNKSDEVGDGYVAQAGFSSGFCDTFILSVTMNGEALSYPLVNGISVSMNCPTGYLEREFALFNKKNGQKIATEVVNNKLNFKLKDTTELVLVISGNKASTDYADRNSAKTVEVFGRTWPLGSFLGVVLGIGLGAIAAAVLILLLGGKKG